MSYLSDWREAEEASIAARAANPLCDESADCPAPDDGHLVGCRGNRIRLAALLARPSKAAEEETDGPA